MFYNQLIPRLRQEVGQTAVLKVKQCSSANSFVRQANPVK